MLQTWKLFALTAKTQTLIRYTTGITASILLDYVALDATIAFLHYKNSTGTAVYTTFANEFAF